MYSSIQNTSIRRQRGSSPLASSTLLHESLLNPAGNQEYGQLFSRTAKPFTSIHERVYEADVDISRVDLRMKALELEEAEQLRKSYIAQKERDHIQQSAELKNEIKLLREALSDAESKLYENNLKRSELQTNNRVLQETVSHLEDQCREYQVQVSDLQSLIRASKEKFLVHESEIEIDYQNRLQKLQTALSLQSERMFEIETKREADFSAKLDDMQSTIRQLKERNAHLDSDLRNMQADKELLSASYQTANESLSRYQARLQEQAEQIRVKEAEVTRHVQLLRTAHLESDGLKEQLRLLEGEKAKKISEISNLQEELHTAKQMEKTVIELELQLSNVRRERDLLQSDIKSLQLEVETLENRKKNDEMVLYEIEKLRYNNARLIQLLASTVEFQDFLFDTKDSGGASFIIPKQAAKKKATAFSSAEIDSVIPAAVMDKLRESEMQTFQAKKERESWIPDQIHQMAHFFMRKYLPELDTLIIHDFLLAMNQIFREREEKKIIRLKTQQAEEVSMMQKEWKSRLPYDSVIKSGKIQHLKKELKKALEGTKKTGMLETRHARLLESSLSAFESLSDPTSVLDRSAATNEGGFMEGVFWMNSKIEGLLNLFFHKVSGLTVEYQKQAVDLWSSPQDFSTKFIRLQTLFMEEVDAMINDIRQSLKDSLMDGKRISYGLQQAPRSSSPFHATLQAGYRK